MATSRVCNGCRIEKPLADFGTIPYRDHAVYARCRDCRNAAARLDYQTNKERYFTHARKRDADLDALINAYKARPCADCGIEYPPYVMDLDHREPEEKVDKVSTMRRRRMAFAKIIAEMEKCDVVCANCHRERTNTTRPARYSESARAARAGARPVPRVA